MSRLDFDTGAGGGSTTITGPLPAGTNVIGGVQVVDGTTPSQKAAVSATGAVAVAGSVADAVTDTGNPVKAGGKYNVTKPTYLDGQRADLQVGSRGALAVTLYSENATTAYGINTDNADGVLVTATLSRLPVVTRLYGFNGTSFDRLRSSATTTGLLQSQVTGAASGGTTMSRVQSAATTNATNAKNGAGTVYNVQLTNTGVAAVFFKFYNKASAPTVGTDVPVWTVAIPAGQSVNFTTTTGLAFATGISYAITNLVADSDTTAVLLNQVTGVIGYV